LFRAFSLHQIGAPAPSSIARKRRSALEGVERDRGHWLASRKDLSAKILGLTLTAEPFEFRQLREMASSNHGQKSEAILWLLAIGLDFSRAEM
jgi:hypothetical protein